MSETVKENCKHPDCKYRRVFNKEPMCAYLTITGKVRGTSISECDKYDTGKVKTVSTFGGVYYDDIQ